jgi:hypothetical protein
VPVRDTLTEREIHEMFFAIPGGYIDAFRELGWEVTYEAYGRTTFGPAAPEPVKAKTFPEWLAETSALLEECAERKK